jgi:hypothetical protein
MNPAASRVWHGVIENWRWKVSNQNGIANQRNNRVEAGTWRAEMKGSELVTELQAVASLGEDICIALCSRLSPPARPHVCPCVPRFGPVRAPRRPS